MPDAGQMQQVGRGPAQVHRDESHGEQTRPGVPKWEYMTWETTNTNAGRSLRVVNGEKLEEYRPEYPALAEAGEAGWDLTAVVASGGKQEHTLYFKRPLAEG